MTKIALLLRSNQNIFTAQDLSVFWNVNTKKKLWENIKYYLRTGALIQLKRGLYCLEEKKNEFELAQRVFSPSYVSFYTALAANGIVFQYYSTIHSMAQKTRTIKIKDQIFKYHQIKPEVFLNPLGIEKKKNYLIAGKERAICDSLYLVPSLAFDNLSDLNKEKLLIIAKIYGNKKLEKEIKKIAQQIN